jgi:uncharacterized protein YukE
MRPADWSDVRFDHASAAAAAAALRSCADLLDAQTDRRVTLARTAQCEWRGRARTEFDDQLARMLREAAGLVAALRAAAGRLDAAAAEAVTEQRRREAARLEWRRALDRPH